MGLYCQLYIYLRDTKKPLRLNRRRATSYIIIQIIANLLISS